MPPFSPTPRATGAHTHTSAQLAAEAVRRLHPYGGFTPDGIELLTCAAFFTASRPAYRQALRVDWVDQLSFVNEPGSCMDTGVIKEESGGRKFFSLPATVASQPLPSNQDSKRHSQESTVERTLSRLISKRGLTPGAIDWFLPHHSADDFRQELYDQLRAIGFAIPIEKWFNLCERTAGAASIYIILAELFHSGRLRIGDRLFCLIPENDRDMQLTVV